MQFVTEIVIMFLCLNLFLIGVEMNVYLDIVIDTHVYILYILIIMFVLEYVGQFYLLLRSLFAIKTPSVEKATAQLWRNSYFIICFLIAVYKLYFDSDYVRISNRIFSLLVLSFIYLISAYFVYKLLLKFQKKIKTHYKTK